MTNSVTPNGEKEKNIKRKSATEIKVTKTSKADEKIREFFGTYLDKDGEELNVKAIIYDSQELGKNISVENSGKRTINPDEITNGLTITVGKQNIKMKEKRRTKKEDRGSER